MNFKIKDEVQLRRYHKLTPANRAKVDQIMKRYFDACAKLDVELETEAAFREAVDRACRVIRLAIHHLC